jgi:hypothetical protein
VRPGRCGGWQAGRAGRGQGAGGLGRTEPDGLGDGGEGEGDLFLVEDPAGDVAVDLERRAVEGAVALAGGGPAEGGQLVGQHSPAVGVAGQVRLGCAGWPGRGRRVGVEQKAEGGRDLGQGCLTETAHPPVGAGGGMPAGWGKYTATDAAPVDVGEAAGWAVAEPGRGEPGVPATAPRSHQRTGEPQAHRACQLVEGGQAGGAVHVQSVEHHPGGQANVGLGPARPPALELAGVGGGVMEAVADQGMLGRPVTGRPAGT